MRVASGDRARRLDRTVLTLLGLAVFAGFVACQWGLMGSYDGRAMASVAKNIWFHGSLRECCNAYGAFPKDHSGYAKFGIGMSLVMAPLWGLHRGATTTHALYLTLSSPLLLTGAVVAIFRTALVLQWRRSTAAIVALLFAFGTMAALYSTSLFSESGVTLGTAVALLGYAMWQATGNAKRGAWLLGSGVAVAALFRPDSFFLVGVMIPGVLLFAAPRSLVKEWRSWVPGIAVPIVLVATWTLFYNAVRFGSVFDFGYGGPYDTQGFSTPVIKGTALQLVSPGKGIIWYSPILLAAIPGLWYLSRQRRPLTILIVGVSALRVLFYARWWTPVGGASWGPRFLLPLCALLIVPVGALIEHLHELGSTRRAIASATLGLLAAVSIAVQVVAVGTEYANIEHAATNVHGSAAEVARIVGERTHHLQWTWDGSPLRIAFAEFNMRQTPMHWFGSGRWPLGALLLFAAVSAAVLAFLVARTADRLRAS